MEFLGRRVRILPTADSDLGQLHAGEYGEIRRQVGTLQEGVKEYEVRLDSGEALILKPTEVEILDCGRGPPPEKPTQRKMRRGRRSPALSYS